MAEPTRRPRRWLAVTVVGVVLVLGVAIGLFWGDLERTALDPKIPFQAYTPPKAPDYSQRASWRLLPADVAKPDAATPPVDVFFLSPTTYDGGEQWNAPIDDRKSVPYFRRVIAPNYVGPFVGVGRVFAPSYRQASLYTLMTLREDAREARQFAFGDAREAFRYYLANYNDGRPFILVGVEQGGTLGARLLAEEIAPQPGVRDRLVVTYLIDTVVPADKPPIQPCVAKGQTRCVAAWASVLEGEFDRGQALLDRALVWNAQGELVNLNGRPALCFNPLLGATTDAPAAARLNLGAVNATGLEGDVRPPPLARQVSARCLKGVLQVSKPKSAAFDRSGSWTERRKVPGYNLFYLDLEDDALARVAKFTPAAVEPPPARPAKPGMEAASAPRP